MEVPQGGSPGLKGPPRKAMEATKGVQKATKTTPKGAPNGCNQRGGPRLHPLAAPQGGSKGLKGPPSEAVKATKDVQNATKTIPKGTPNGRNQRGGGPRRSQHPQTLAMTV